MKNYADYKVEVVEHIVDYCDGIGQHAIVRLLEDGLIAQDEETRMLIEDTNRKYGHLDAARLVGDYVIAEFDASKDGGYRCRFSIKSLFEMYLDGGWKAVERVIADNIKQVESVDNSIFKQLGKYDQIHDRLLICMRNAKNNDVERRGIVYRQIDDMAMTLYIIVKDDGRGNRLIAPVLRHFAKKWGITDMEIFAAALDNTARLSPPRIFIGIESWMPGGNGDDFMNVLKPLRKLPQNPLSAAVTTLPTSDGAIAMFYPGVQERLSEMAGGDYYAVFAAKDECHVHRADSVTAKLLKERLVDVNHQFPDTMPTANLYYYNSEKRKLQKV